MWLAPFANDRHVERVAIVVADRGRGLARRERRIGGADTEEEALCRFLNLVINDLYLDLGGCGARWNHLPLRLPAPARDWN